MGMGDYFDEDELINDAIAGAEEDEPPYDEYDFSDPDEAMAPATPPATTPTAAPTETAPTAAAPTAATPTAAAPTAAVPACPSSDRNDGDDPYGFERYTGLAAWRVAKGAAPEAGAATMEALTWKKGTSAATRSDGEEGPQRRACAPPAGGLGEARLVRSRARFAWDWDCALGADDALSLPRAALMPVLGVDGVPVTLADGTRAHVPRAGRRAEESDTVGGPGGEKPEESCLLGRPMTELVRRADILQRRAIRQQLEREGRSGQAAAAAGDVTSDTAEEGSSGSGPTAPDKDLADADGNDRERPSARKHPLQKKRHRDDAAQQHRLWVDKHAPTNVSHLLSDERTNREVLRALRAWDPYVFKREAPARPAPAYPNHWQTKEATESHKSAWQRGTAKDGKEAGADQDKRADPRPPENARVLLLSGPPGVGKTTLANIVCQHAGYRPIEVNASDERTASALMERVMRAMESSTLDFSSEAKKEGGMARNTKGGGKPNCIILDEVDGADAKAAIAALVDVVRSDLPAPGARAKKNGKKGVSHLRRPIILICNHKYAPALRPILPYARQFDVRPPAPERLAARLRAVLASERLSVVAGGVLLRRLVAASGGDIRSCLYALQFASARAREVAQRKRMVAQGGERSQRTAIIDISGTLMLSLGDKGTGMKDMQSDVASTVATVFRKAKKEATSSSHQNKRQKKGSHAKATTSGVNIVLKAVDHFGDNSKTLDCLFTNVNRVSFIDPTLDRTSAALEWLSEADTFRSQKSTVAANNTAELHSLQKFYIPSAAGAVHLLCRVETRPDLMFNTRRLADVHFHAEANASLVCRFLEGLAPSARQGGCGGGVEAVVGDVIPFALWLLSAGEGKHALSRPVSSVDILDERESVAFGEHVETLRALGLTYVTDEDTSTFGHEGSRETVRVRLEPEIEKLVRFEDMNGDASGRSTDAAAICRRADIPPLLKELLAHGATVAALRERESEAQIIAQHEDTKVGQQKKLTQNGAPGVEKSAAAVVATPPKLPPKKANSNTSAAKNFLGFRAAKAKQAKNSRRAARVGVEQSSSKKVKLSNTGSGVEFTKVIRFKYQKGFTQAVRAPCKFEDLL